MRLADPNHGSHRHHGIWTYLDQILVSEALLDEAAPFIKMKRAFVYSAGFLLEEDDKYQGLKPYRHFAGYRLNGGFSDHLPVYVDLQLSGQVGPEK